MRVFGRDNRTMAPRHSPLAKSHATTSLSGRELELAGAEALTARNEHLPDR
jgi:hypothetical protein